MDMRDLIDGEAELEDEEEEELETEEIDAETGEVRRRQDGGNRRKHKADFEDSSEEEDEEDEEEAAKIRAGFIVDDEEDDVEEQEDGTEIRVKKRRKRRRSQRDEDEDEGLDEEDLDLMLENTGEGGRSERQQSQFKRLKRGREDGRRDRRASRDLLDIFSDDEGDVGAEPEDRGQQRRGPGIMDEFDDFIEEDDLSDNDGRQAGSDDEMRIDSGRRREHRRTHIETGNLGLREGAEQDYLEIFGMGDEYEEALVLDLDDEALERQTEDLQLKDVFEPSELQEKMLTDEDNEIKIKDLPERFQLAWKQYQNLEITDEDIEFEASWMSKIMFPPKQRDFEESMMFSMESHFKNAIRDCLRFMIRDNLEVPFIFQHRRDYLIRAEKIMRSSPADGEQAYTLSTAKLLYQDDLWKIFDLDLKFRAFLEKRNSIRFAYNSLIESGVPEDPIVKGRLPKVDTMESLQDINDYLQLRYAAELKDQTLTNGNGHAAPSRRRPGAGRTQFERIRAGKAYSLVNAFGLSAEQFAANVAAGKKREFAEDPIDLPDTMADACIDYPDYPTGPSALKAAKLMLAEEIFTNPRMREAMRGKYFSDSVISINPTEKGVKQIDEQHQYYPFKYLKNQALRSIGANPALYLKMIKAESDGYVEIVIELFNEERYIDELNDFITSDNYSEVAEAWNTERKEVVSIAMRKLSLYFKKALRDELGSMCEDVVANGVKETFVKRLDQAPYRPKMLGPGDIPRVFAVSNGEGIRGRDAVVGVFVSEDGIVQHSQKFGDLRDPEPRQAFKEVVSIRKPDLIAISGFSVETSKLYEDVRKLVEEYDLTTEEDDEDGEKSLVEVLYVNDEAARLYQNSPRAEVDHPDLPPLLRYCCALARYVQSPLCEYAALREDVVSINFHPAQNLLSQEKLRRCLEYAMVEIVNLVGVNLHDAAKNEYVANLLPYVAGLGHRKTDALLKYMQRTGGSVSSRMQLVLGDLEDGIAPIFGPKVYENCASFLIIPHNAKDKDNDYLDCTRVHPEDYELGRKMAADALDLDELDVVDQQNTNGPGAVINSLINGQEYKVNELILEEYAEELERKFNQQKRSTLETIKAELKLAYEELRAKWHRLEPDEVFTMLTGETKESLDEKMVVSVVIKRVTDRYIAARLDCGIEGNVSSEEMPQEALAVRPSYFYHQGQAVQARIESLSRKTFYAELSLREEKIREPRRPQLDLAPDEWDDVREERDKARLAVKNQEQTRTARVIKHPLFRAMNARQAEDFLRNQTPGDAVIRPSSNGPDHIAVTWKVADNIYQHIDVLELDKKNEFTVGRTLRVGGKFSYADLDELIVNHVKSMARKVDELSHHSKFQSGTREEVEKWLEKYCEANPKRSSYTFCFDYKRPGYFMLLYKAGANSTLGTWPVKVVPGAYQLKETVFPDVTALCNGFKTMHTHLSQRTRGRM